MVIIMKALEVLLHELLLFSAIWMLVGAVDDLCIDVIWIVRRSYRRIAYYRSQPPMRAAQLPAPKRPGLIAVFIPTWNEANVIGAMLAQCSLNWRDARCEHRVYVGYYSNDEAGIATVLAVAPYYPNVHLVRVAHAGPTTKADCLNSIWHHLNADELAEGFKAKAVALHDAEDAVHPDELDVFARLIENANAVQLPVIPIRTARSRWVSAHYCDEFAEAHGKLMVVREAIGASLPLAGVGCAIERNMLGRIATGNGSRPFDEKSLTEDYELGLRIGAMGGRTIMARIEDKHAQLVGTRAYFPDTMNAAVRQKTRWLTGIALAGWDRLGWQGSFADKWMLLHDRRSIFAALVLFAAYICLALTAILLIFYAAGRYHPAPLSDAFNVLLSINAFFLAWRMLIRGAFVWSIYGPKEALLSAPRGIVANIISIAAARRACWKYLQYCFGKPLIWEKTEHHVVPIISTKHD
jgi:bacteriophage N4 adsorption protein B